ncbi:MAG: hypothetical protein IJ200_07925 [Prevotella sp.]|nr:hypothetical protein [Prevotella sp.]
MRHYILRAFAVLLFAMTASAVLAQDYMNVFFKDGSSQKFYLKNVVEMVTSKVDADGVTHSDYDYQHITTFYDNYVYSLDDVDYITFTKFYEEKAEENLAEAMTDALVVAGGCQNVEEANANLDAINNKPGVEKAWTDDNNLYVKIKDWETITYHFPHAGDVTAARQQHARMMEQLQELKPQLKKVVKPDGTPISAVVACQVSNDERAFYQEAANYVAELNNFFKSCGIETKNVSPTVDFFANEIFEHDYVFLVTHGTFESSHSTAALTHYLLTSNELGALSEEEISLGGPRPEYINEKARNIINSFSEQAIDYIGVTWVAEVRNGKNLGVYYLSINEDFFTHVAKKNFPSTHSIFFNAACESLKGEGQEPSYSLAQKLVDRGLGLYLGYTRVNAAGHHAGNEYFKAMLQGTDARNAYMGLDAELRDNHFQNDVARLLPYPVNFTGVSDMFLTPVYTNLKDHEQAQQQFQQDNCVTLEGTATLLDDSKATLGFEYGFDDINLTMNVPAEIVPMTLNSEKGNVLFRATTPPLQTGRTYYFRAYNRDGSTFNYGDVVSFSIDHPALQLHTNSVSMEANTTTDVVIQQGSGNYTVKSSNSDVAEATVDIDHVHILAYAAGEATITVTDVLSGKTADILVTVTKPKETPANAIDLGLPSGTLWASYNVGATKPEEYGGYFAWGETDTKDYYGWDNYIHCDGTKDTCHDLGADIAGTDYDVAHVHWGEKWTTPTKAQINELTKQCTKEWTTQNGVKGCKITGPNGNSIFLPAVGFSVYSYLPYQGGESGLYMSSTECDSSENWCLNTDEKTFTWNGIWKFYGYAVRPVISPEPEYVENADQPLDLGLTSGTLWAQCNLGASQPHEPGNYYAWGETKPKDKYTKANYALYDSNTDTYTDIGTDISGTQYDAATATLGSGWHMPTYAEFTELKNECEWKYAVMNGVNGYRVTGPNGKSIFLPCADNQEDESTYPAAPSDTDGFYWSSRQMQAGYTISLHFDENGAYWPHGYLSFMGFSIRPVKSK